MYVSWSLLIKRPFFFGIQMPLSTGWSEVSDLSDDGAVVVSEDDGRVVTSEGEESIRTPVYDSEDDAVEWPGKEFGVPSSGHEHALLSPRCY
jgi:hypothetical protein